MGFFILIGILYLLFFVIGNSVDRTNPWNTTFIDRVFWFPVEIAFMTLGWSIQNAPLIAAAMIPLTPILLFLWLLWFA